MTIVEIELAIETTAKLQRRLIEATTRTEASKRVDKLNAADELFEGLAATLGFRVERIEEDA